MLFRKSSSVFKIWTSRRATSGGADAALLQQAAMALLGGSGPGLSGSLAGAMGTLYIFYDLSRRFTLRAQAGEQSAIDLIFTLRYD